MNVIKYPYNTHLQWHVSLQIVNKDTTKYAGKSTLDVDHAYQIPLQSDKIVKVVGSTNPVSQTSLPRNHLQTQTLQAYNDT